MRTSYSLGGYYPTNCELRLRPRHELRRLLVSEEVEDQPCHEVSLLQRSRLSISLRSDLHRRKGHPHRRPGSGDRSQCDLTSMLLDNAKYHRQTKASTRVAFGREEWFKGSCQA